MDLGRPESVTEAAGALSAQVGGLDAVVLCAGHNVSCAEREWRQQAGAGDMEDRAVAKAVGSRAEDAA
jgi:NAD(P)-dependent dehydrogenase (short-subunit alcohol dehydrogenase family)